MENVEDILKDCETLLDNCKALDREMEAEKEGLDFLLNEYKTNKRWFREEPGRVTVEDVIKAAYQFGWASKSNFDYAQSRKNPIRNALG